VVKLNDKLSVGGNI